jgi:hypothetical protein
VEPMTWYAVRVNGKVQFQSFVGTSKSLNVCSICNYKISSHVVLHDWTIGETMPMSPIPLILCPGTIDHVRTA